MYLKNLGRFNTYNRKEAKKHVPFTICSYYANSAFKKSLKKLKNQQPFHKIKPIDLFSIYKKQRGICPFTGDKLTGETMSVDHIIPSCQGGLNTKDNIRLIHVDVNRMRLNYSDEEFLRLTKIIVERANQLD